MSKDVVIYGGPMDGAVVVCSDNTTSLGLLHKTHHHQCYLQWGLLRDGTFGWFVQDPRSA